MTFTHHAACDALERRTLFDGQMTLTSSGTLCIWGDRADNSIDIRFDGQQVRVTLDADTRWFARTAVRRVLVSAGGGDDTIAHRTTRPATLNGEAGDDTIRGGSVGETLNGGRGADVLSPGDGSNVILADAADLVDYSRLTGRAFDIVAAAGEPNETVAIIRHSGYVDRYVCVDGYALSARLTDQADALSIIATDDESRFEGRIRVRIDMAGGDDTLTRGIGVATTVLGGAGNDAFPLSEESGAKDYFNSVAVRDGGSGDDYFEALLESQDYRGGAGFDTVSFSNSHYTGLYSPELDGRVERYVSDGPVSYFRNKGRGVVAIVNSLYIAGDEGDTIFGASGASESYSGGPGDDVFLVRNGLVDSIDGGGGNDHADADSFDVLEGIATIGPRPDLAALGRIDLAPVTPGAALSEVPAPFVSPAGTLIVVNGDGGSDVEARVEAASIVVAADGREVTRAGKSAVKRLWLDGQSGADTLANRTGLPAVMVGGAGDDTVVDGAGNDRVIDLAGDNTARIDAGFNQFEGHFEVISYESTTGPRVFEVQVYPQDVFAGAMGVGRPAESAIDGPYQDYFVDYSTSWFEVALTPLADTLTVGSFGEEGIGGSGVVVKMGGGDDVVESAERDDYGSVLVRAGAGDDTFPLDLDLDYSATVDGGPGEDTALVGVFSTVELPAVAERFVISGDAFGEFPLVVQDSDQSSLIDATGVRRPIEIHGNGGDDTIPGSNFADTIDGGGGHDKIEGRAGNDVLTGGPGRDRIFAGSGNDRVLARDSGRDLLDGGAGTDDALVDPVDTLVGLENVTR